MCVRYTLHKTDAALAAIAQALARKLAPPEWARPRYNVTLTHIMPVVAVGADGPEVRGMMWGLVPFYERKKPQMRMLPNAKAETATTLSAFKQSTAKRRCLVPANGFYEWQTVGKLKLPHLFTLKGEEPFAFAGIWEPAEGNTPETFGILTTEPNELVAPIHNRMPVILTQATMPRWLGSEPLAEDEYRALTKPLPAGLMSERPVNRFVNNSRNEGPQCLEPPEEAPPELALG
ncbi:MAG TPA: SOS response-associated peptidase [Opitutaceae bacterium]|nr:SOS response-associated peptidase [Opitutaceae bacterium]